jgi:MFS family permease
VPTLTPSACARETTGLTSLDATFKDRHYRRNVFGVSAVEFIWGLGLPVVVESTFLQLFLKNMGASSLALGMIPFFFFIGTSVFALLSSYLTEGMVFKRGPVIILHLISGASLLVFGSLLIWLDSSTHILLLFFSCYAVFSVCIGMTLPVWLNYLVKLFSEEKSTAGLAYMMIAQNAAKLVSSLLILRVVERYAFAPLASAVVFLVVGILFVAGSLCFLLTREARDAGRRTPRRPSFLTFVAQTRRHMFRNRNFLVFLGSDLELYIVVTVISFYAAYATEYGGVVPAVAAGVFVGLIYSGAILANIGLGTLGWLTLRQKAMASKACSIAAVLLLAIWGTPVSFYLASFLLGAARGTRMIVFAPAVKKLSGLADATPYFAVAPVLTLPAAMGLPLFCGHFLDRMAWMGADAYRLMLAMTAVLLAGTLVCAWRTDFSAPPARPPVGQAAESRRSADQNAPARADEGDRGPALDDAPCPAEHGLSDRTGG